jgi:hypothetical protein
VDSFVTRTGSARSDIDGVLDRVVGRHVVVVACTSFRAYMGSTRIHLHWR